MKRNWDLIRDLLFYVEDRGKLDSWIDPIEAIKDKHDPDNILYNTKLIYEAGLIEWSDISSHSGLAYRIRGLTFEGHDFIDCIREDTIWNKVKNKLKDVGGAASLQVLVSLAKKTVTDHLGL